MNGFLAYALVVFGIVVLAVVVAVVRDELRPARTARCGGPAQHNLPDLQPASRCRWCGQSVAKLMQGAWPR